MNEDRDDQKPQIYEGQWMGKKQLDQRAKGKKTKKINALHTVSVSVSVNLSQVWQGKRNYCTL